MCRSRPSGNVCDGAPLADVTHSLRRTRRAFVPPVIGLAACAMPNLKTGSSPCRVPSAIPSPPALLVTLAGQVGQSG